MPSLSPNATPTAGMPLSPRRSVGSRPGATKRNSAQSASQLVRQGGPSPSSAGEQQHVPLQKQHAVRAGRHTKIVLPRNHSSGRNLAKLARQVQQQEEHRRHARKQSHEHEGDTEIRLPGSLDESRPPPMRRNLTAYQLPRANSQVKLKKNLSHGHLSRLQSGRSMLALSSTQHKAPPSPGLKGKAKRPKAEVDPEEMDLHEQEVELLRQKRLGKTSSRKTGFAVGSAGDVSDNEDVPDMEGSGMQEDEWTEESASASPFSTRQNTANNSRRASVNFHDRNVDKGTTASPRELVRATLRTKVDAETRQAEPRRSPLLRPKQDAVETSSASDEEDDEDDMDEDEDDEIDDSAEEADEENEADEPVVSPLTMSKARAQVNNTNTQQQQLPPPASASEATIEYTKLPVESKAPQKSPLHTGRELNNPATRRILSRSQQLPAPALISNISAMDDSHSSHESPTASRRSSKSHLENGSVDAEDELVSRFVPSTSHPATGSGVNTTMNTPRQSGFHTPTDEHMRRARGLHMAGGPASPGSTISGSSGAATPALGRSRIELKMLGEKALADREAVAERAPIYPHHVYDRRNETLKSYLNAATSLAHDGRGSIGTATGLPLGPEIFQGRFKAVNTELKVVLKFRDPVVESVERLRRCKDSKLNQRSSSSLKQTAAVTLKTSKSAVTLPARHATKLSTSTTPPAPNRASETPKNETPSTPLQGNTAVTATPPTTSSTPVVRGATPRRGVSFAGAPRGTDIPDRTEAAVSTELGPDVIARQLWEGL